MLPKPPRFYRDEAKRFREAAEAANGALKQDFEELAMLYEKLAEHLEQLEGQPRSADGS